MAYPEESSIRAAMEALLFVSDEPVSAIALADMVGVDAIEAETELMAMAEAYAQNEHGIQLREIAGGWQFCTKDTYYDLLERYVLSWDTRRMSQASLETLAIIAYSQPVTRAGVSSIRGVNSDSSINSLMEKGLVREAGTADTPGNPMRYATTRTFLEKFGLRSVDDLPEIELFAPDDETRMLIAERLGATKSQYASVFDTADSLFDAIDPGEGTEPAAEPVEPGSSTTTEPSMMEETLFSGFAAQDPQEMLKSAIASSFGLVEKIDLSTLEFELGEDDE